MEKQIRNLIAIAGSVLLVALCFAPIGNVMLCAVFFGVSLMGHSEGDFYIKSWLLEEPEKKVEED